MRRRGGFTLIEVLIAVILVDVALLALVAAGSTLVRRTTEVRLRTTAARLAVDRLQLLGASACVATVGTTTNPGSIREFWGAASPANGVRELFDSVTFTVAGVEKAVALHTRLPC
jgi:Tfp pilus assembly protein PilV